MSSKVLKYECLKKSIKICVKHIISKNFPSLEKSSAVAEVLLYF